MVNSFRTREGNPLICWLVLLVALVSECGMLEVDCHQRVVGRKVETNLCRRGFFPVCERRSSKDHTLDIVPLVNKLAEPFSDSISIRVMDTGELE